MHLVTREREERQADETSRDATERIRRDVRPGADALMFFADVEPGRKGEILDSALHVFAETRLRRRLDARDRQGRRA